MAVRPEFPGVIIDLVGECCVDEVELSTIPLKTCECFQDCGDPGGPPPIVTECFIYGVVAGNLDRGCADLQLDDALGVSIGGLFAQFLVRVNSLVGGKDWLQGGGSMSETAFRVVLGLGAVVAQIVILAVDDAGKRISITFVPPAGNPFEATVRLDAFTLLDGTFNFNNVSPVYVGFLNNSAGSSCLLAIDDFKVCSKASNYAAGVTFDETAPFAELAGGESCVTIRNFDTGGAELVHVTCNAPYPPNPTQPCDLCIQANAINEGSGALHFCVGAVPPASPFLTARVFAAPIAFGVNEVTVDVNRNGTTLQWLFIDSAGCRAVSVVQNMLAGSTTLLQAAIVFAQDPGFNSADVVQSMLAFAVSENAQVGDVYKVDNLNDGSSLLEGFNSIATSLISGEITCAYNSLPAACLVPQGLTCLLTTRTSDLGGSRQMLDMSIDSDLTIGRLTVSRDGTGTPTPVDLLQDLNPATADIRLLLNNPDGLTFDGIDFAAIDDQGRRFTVNVTPEAALPAGAFSVIALTGFGGGQVAYPDLLTKGQFDRTRVVRFEWQLRRTYGGQPGVFSIDGFQIRLGGVPQYEYNFTGYANMAAATADAVECGEDWAQRIITPTGMSARPITSPGGWDAVQNNHPSDPAFGTKVLVSDQAFGDDTDERFVGKDFRLDPAHDTIEGIGLAGVWAGVQIDYVARPLADGANMRLSIIDDGGLEAFIDFSNDATDTLIGPVGIRRRCLARAGFTEPLGAISDNITRVRLLKTPGTGTAQLTPADEGTARDQVGRAGLGAVRVTFTSDAGCAASIGVGDFVTGLTVEEAFRQGSEVGQVDESAGFWNGRVLTFLADDGVGSMPPFVPEPGDQIVVHKLSIGPTAYARWNLPAPTDVTPNALIRVRIASEFTDMRPQLGQVIMRLNTPTGVQGMILGGTIFDFGPPGGPAVYPAQQIWGTMFFQIGGSFPISGAPNLLLVTSIELATLGGPGWTFGRLWLGLVDGDATGSLVSPNRTALGNFDFSNPPNVVTVGEEIDPCSVPLIALNRDRTQVIAYWGQSEDTIRAAEIVLVPAKYKDDPVVGEDAPDPCTIALPTAEQQLACDVRAKYGEIGFKNPPVKGCRNIWIDLVYLDELRCMGVELTSQSYTFFESECGCNLEFFSQEVAGLVTDGCMARILPDDEFQAFGYEPLPAGYPEAISFDYCAFPRIDRFETAENSLFRFRRETPKCVLPGNVPPEGHYVVRVKITALQLPLSVDWVDTLPAGETLVSGVLSDTLVFTTVGETITREYVVKTNKADALTITISGTAEKTGLPITQIILVGEQILVDADCDTLQFNSFGSQNPNVYGEVFWAGGGRTDPVVPANHNLWVKVWAGPGSGGLSGREVFLANNTVVPALSPSFVFQMPVNGTDGFSPGLPVWVFNGCFAGVTPTRKITCLDIEQELLNPDPNEDVTGLYGTVTAVDPILSTLTIAFNVPPNQNVNFTIAAKAAVMVAPDGSKGYYWEASPELVGACGLGGPSNCIMRWGYRFWNSTQNPCPGTLGAAYICDGNGESVQYEIQGDLVKEILNPVDWIDLLCSPINEVPLVVDALPSNDLIQVCDICLFQPCDVVQLVDLDCTGREGNGPGYVGAVVETIPLNPLDDCNVLPAVQGYVRVSPPIPAAINGCPGFDSFEIGRRARLFVKPDVSRLAFSATTKCSIVPEPLDGTQYVCVDFETGTFTFDPLIVARNPKICYKALHKIIQLPTDTGTYMLRGVDKCGCKSPPSKPIRIIGEDDPPPPPPGGGGLNEAAKLIGIANISSGGLTVTSATVAATPLPSSGVTFTLLVPSRIKFEASLWQFNVADIGDPGGMGEADAFAFLELRDTGGPTLYPMANRHNDNASDPQKVDVGAGSTMVRVLDLAAGTYTFDLTGRAVNANGGSDNTVQFISVYPLTFLVFDMGAL